MHSLAWRLRAGALLLAGVLALHQLRYLLSYGAQAHEQLGAQGHAYLAALVSPVLLLLALAILHFGAVLRRAWCGASSTTGADAPPPTVRRLWSGASAFLLVAYAAQEGLEGVLATGHPAGWQGVFGHGGWVALPLALVLGLLVALLLRGAAAAVARLVRVRPPGRPRRAPSAVRAAYRAALPAPDPVSRFLTGRGPPLASA